MTPQEEQLAKIKAQASRDYFSMKGKYRPPYTPGTPEHDAYERGWMQSLKRDGARLVDMDALQGRSPRVR